jgi:sec-independent protein translocase protein TatA
MANFGTTEVLIILIVLLLLFGSTKLPQLARSLGRSARILKAETKGLHDDETPQPHPGTPAPATGEQAPHPQAPGQNALPPGPPVHGAPLPAPHSHRDFL